MVSLRSLIVILDKKVSPKIDWRVLVFFCSSVPVKTPSSSVTVCKPSVINKWGCAADTLHKMITGTGAFHTIRIERGHNYKVKISPIQIQVLTYHKKNPKNNPLSQAAITRRLDSNPPHAFYRSQSQWVNSPFGATMCHLYKTKLLTELSVHLNQGRTTGVCNTRQWLYSSTQCVYYIISPKKCLRVVH